MHDIPYKETYMPSIRLDKDVVPLSRFRANVSLVVQQVMETGRPVLVTQHGRGAVVLLDVREFEAMRERAALGDGGAGDFKPLGSMQRQT